jgi:ribosomal protein S18 acetylase RimI-like enzyme
METWKGPLRLSVSNTNRIAIELHTTLGFEVYEEFEGSMYGRRIPAARMRLFRELKAE